MTAYKFLAMTVIGAIGVAGCTGGNPAYVVDGYASFPDKPGCPGFSVHVARTGNVVSGTAMRDGVSKISTLSGSVDALNRFKVAITPVDAGAPTGTVEGVIAPAAGTVTGTLSNAGCNNGPILMRFMPRSFSSSGSG